MSTAAREGSAERIGRAVERRMRTLALRPSAGRGTAVTSVTARDGLRCEITDGTWRLAADLGESAGGTASAPDPGVLGRSALGACLAIGYLSWAAHLGVALEEVRVDVEADYDAASHYGLSPAPPGYSAVRYTVTVRSSASESDILRVLDRADAHSSYLDVFRRPIPVDRYVRIEPSGAR